MESFWVLYTASLIFGSFSLLGCIFICVVYLKFPRLSGYPFRLIVYLSILDGFESLSWSFPGFILGPKYCLIQSLGIQFFGLSSLLWIGVICLLLYLQAIQNHSHPEKYEKYYLFAIVFISLVSTITVYAFDISGYVGGHCWIVDKGIGTILRFVMFYIPAWAIIIFISFTYFKIIRKVKKESCLVSQLQDEGKTLVNKLKLYPIAMIFCFAPLTLYRISQDFEGEIFWFYVICLAIYNLKGFINAFIYGLNESVKDELSRGYERNIEISLEENI